MTSLQMAMEMAKTLWDKKAQALTVLRIEPLTVLADYFIICTGTSTTHLRALADEVERVMDGHEIRLHHREGYVSGGWLLMDYGSVAVHLFLKDTREFYMLERMWADAEKIDLSGITEENKA